MSEPLSKEDWISRAAACLVAEYEFSESDAKSFAEQLYSNADQEDMDAETPEEYVDVEMACWEAGDPETGEPTPP